MKYPNIKAMTARCTLPNQFREIIREAFYLLNVCLKFIQAIEETKDEKDFLVAFADVADSWRQNVAVVVVASQVYIPRCSRSILRWFLKL